MENNGADFTHKEICLLMETIFENELGVYVAKDFKSLRDKVDVFRNDDQITVKRIRNKQGKTRVSVFQTCYCDACGMKSTAYTVTI